MTNSKDFRDSDSPFGVLEFFSWDHARFGPHYRPGDAEQAAHLMQEAGVGFARFDFLWEDIEPEEGRFVFDKYDRLVDLLLEKGIKIQALLAYNAGWAGAWNQAPDPIRYGRYARAVVDHFKDRVRHYQIWHEPDSPMFWQPQDQMQTYVRVLKHVYPILKSVDPTCVIHLGGMSRSLPVCLKHIYERGAKDYFDVVNIHPFANPLTPDALGALRDLHHIVRGVLEQYGDGAKPIWFTEIGCPGMKDPLAAPNWWLGKNPTESIQAGWIGTIYSELLHWKGVEKVFWCFFRDTVNHFKSGSDFDGLVTHDFQRKPSFFAYRNAVERHRLASPQR
jgi:hypothetical protein